MMIKSTTLILEIQEAIDLLIETYTDKLMSDREFAKECVVRHQMMMPNINQLDDRELAVRFSEMKELCVKLCQSWYVDRIMLKVGKYHLIQVYEHEIPVQVENDEVPF